jgi:bifunctional non-homologous end joining protein LigD
MEVELTHRDKVLFPDSAITKGNLIDYYEKIAEHMIPFLKDRPLTMHRFPAGITKEGFFQKNASSYFPDWIKTALIKKKNGWVNHVICNTTETLLYLVNQGTITFHTALSRVDKLEFPDRLIFDLDPPNDNFDVVVEGARTIREILEKKLGMATFPMATGSKGLHVVIPLNCTENFNEVHDFAKKVATYVCYNHPEKYTTAMQKNQRKGRLFLDYMRNSYAHTGVCPFSVRAIEGAPVATPLHWDELDSNTMNARTYTIHNIFQRLEEIENPWKLFEKQRKSINVAKVHLEKLLEESTHMESTQH